MSGLYTALVRNGKFLMVISSTEAGIWFFIIHCVGKQTELSSRQENNAKK
jgi:hypothetical protein